MYKVKEFDSTLERRIVIGMVVSDDFLSEAQTLFQPEYFRVPALRTAAGWCIKYWGEFGKSPGSHFQDIYESKRRTGEVPDEFTEELEAVFSSLSKEFVENPNLNPRYLLKQMEQLMRSRSLLQLGEDIVALASQDKVDDAELSLSQFKPVRREGISWSNPFDLSDNQMEDVFKEGDALFRFPGPLGELIGPIERDSFIGLQAPEKRGKTWFLWEFALRGVLNRCNVAFFSVGDMSDVQNWRRVFGWVLRSSKRWGGKETLVPVMDCKKAQKGECDDCDQEPVMTSDGKLLPFDQAPYHQPCIKCLKDDPYNFIGSRWYKRELIPDYSPGKARQLLANLSKRCAGKTIRLQCYPSYQANVRKIRTMLDIWEKRDGWIADMVVIDYADILAPEDEREAETRHRINTTWGTLRGLSTERGIAVITATQAAKTSYTKTQQDTTDVSEDKRKLGHVTAMIGLNQTPEEKKSKLMRVSNLIVREDDFDSRRNVVCLQCLEMSRPLLGSFWLK